MRKVFVLTSHYESEEYQSNTNVIGVYNTRSKAQEIMDKEYRLELKKWKETYDVDEEGIEEEVTDDYVSLFNLMNNVDYTKFEITEHIIQ